MSVTDNESHCTSTLLRLGGRVQGVGFRPFLFRLASEHGLNGWVENLGTEVQLLLQGEQHAIETLLRQVLDQPPPLAKPKLLLRETIQAPHHGQFSIRRSQATDSASAHIPPDLFLCNDCLAELRNPRDRRYRYPFSNCTQCGPRYTLIARLPYDRANTAMAGFPLCPDCEAEYTDPLNRRFHAEPTACPACGPKLRFQADGKQLEGNEEALAAALNLLQEGGILAVKGIGGFHLMCDASNEQAVKRLRQAKARPHKPLAVMFPQRGRDGLEEVQRHLQPTDKEAELLASPLRPIVLCRKGGEPLADSLAPGLDELGAMLPYSPLHHLLLEEMGVPLVATSGNISGEPVLTDNEEALIRLGSIADAFLLHNRPILRPADDPLYRTIAGQPRPLRLGRGNAPLELELPFSQPEPLLAVGGEMKNAIALAWDNRVVLSPHVGELHTPRGMEVFEQVISDLQRLYGVEAKALICDAHPDYHASRWARQQDLPVRPIYHHHAHASGLFGEHETDANDKWLVATWDGTGYGPDGTIWGGETLIGRPGQWRRFSHFRPYRLPGGEKTAKEPWRSALSLCLETGNQWAEAPAEGTLLAQAWQRGLNCPVTTSAGRLFDAAAALLGICDKASFEGQAAMLLESYASDATMNDTVPLPLSLADDGILSCNWEPLLPVLLDNNLSQANRAALFHNSLAQGLLETAKRARKTHGITTVGLTGGVFQNRILTDRIQTLLVANDFTIRLAHSLPCNDGGLAWGQLIEALAKTSG